MPHGPFAVIRSEEDIKNAAASLFPAILKIARFGYDGKGQATVNSCEEAIIAFGRFKGEPCVLEQRLQLDYEISVVLARDQSGQVACFPAGENRHTNGILDVSIVPVQATGCLSGDAETVATRIAENLGYVGIMGAQDGVDLLVRAVAGCYAREPRPRRRHHPRGAELPWRRVRPRSDRGPSCLQRTEGVATPVAGRAASPAPSAVSPAG